MSGLDRSAYKQGFQAAVQHMKKLAEEALSEAAAAGGNKGAPSNTNGPPAVFETTNPFGYPVAPPQPNLIDQVLKNDRTSQSPGATSPGVGQ